MQVANAVNNNIRILFNPTVEAFKLFDFLMVKSGKDRYLAQITEIYDDKFDASQNVARLKLFYKIAQNNEVMPYDNFTPNKECEVARLKQDEIENFVNQDRETFVFATNFKNSSALNIQYNFFDSAVVLADKIENVNAISLNLAKNLSAKKNVILIDATGVVEFDEAKKIKAGKNFKLPLNYSTIEYVFDRCLKNSGLEFQAIGGEIINEIKKFAQKQEASFIPFNLFTKVIIEQYKATPYDELKLLLVRVKRYQMDEIFARTKKDKETLFKTIEKNPITIVDISSVNSFWQKAYMDYLISEFDGEAYLLFRVNDENFDVDLINKIYNEKKNIKFIPNVSYNYKKLPSIMQYCKNYILMPSLYQRSDFLDANFALSNLISDGCIIFGDATDNFLYQAKDYELEMQEKRKNYRKIALTLAQEDDTEEKLGEKGDFFENQKNSSQKQTDHSQRLMKELSEFEEQQKSREENSNKDGSEEVFEEIEEAKIEVEKQDNPQESFHDDFQTVESKNIEFKKEAQDEFQELNQEPENNTLEESEEEKDFDALLEDELKDVEDESRELKITDENEEELSIVDDDSLTIEKEEDSEEDIKNQDDEPLIIEDNEVQDNSSDDEKSKNNEIDLSDDELDFFQIAQESSQGYGDSEKQAEFQNKDELDLNQVADNSIDASFEQIVSTKNPQSTNPIASDDGTKYSGDILDKPLEKENLPIFKEGKDKENFSYKIGDIITHKKYGRGEITKTIRYEQRQLLQIEFEQTGKKLLDPTVADIKLEQN